MIFYKRKLFWALVGVPNILAGTYLFFLASPVYVSQAQLVVYQESGGTSKTLSLGKKRGGTSLEGDYLLATYIHSMHAFSQLNKAELEREWSSGFGVMDYGGLFQAFRHNQDTLWHYYKDSVRYSINPNSAVLTLTINGYSANFPMKLAQKLLAMGQAHLSQLSTAVYQKALAYDQHLVQQQKLILEQAIHKLANYQEHIGILSLSAQNKSRLQTLGQLVVKRAELQAEQAVYKRHEPKSPQTTALAEEIAQLNGQIDHLRDASRGDNVLVRYSREYTLRKTAVVNSEKLLIAEEESMLQTRKNMLSHEYIISYISPPYRPIVPTLPDRFIDFLWILGITFLVYLIVK